MDVTHFRVTGWISGAACHQLFEMICAQQSETATRGGDPLKLAGIGGEGLDDRRGYVSNGERARPAKSPLIPFTLNRAAAHGLPRRFTRLLLPFCLKGAKPVRASQGMRDRAGADDALCVRGRSSGTGPLRETRQRHRCPNGHVAVGQCQW
ncbi:MAG: hypothetical protein EPN48_09800 [Microbacteriaceae bacterium]|nr:MAG: hypothetical protein EPN48_09800 [Microbacteriaceae bacterium]